MRRVSFATVAVVCALGGCHYPNNLNGVRADLLMSDAGINTNALGPNDLLEVKVLQEVDLSGVFRVDPAGVIDFPLCGKVSVGGMTSSGAADAITACLKNGYLRRPQVQASVKEFNSKKVFVFGEVSKPGSFSYEEGMTIIHAISQAGGLTRAAAKNSVNVTRVVDGKEVKVPVKVEDIVIGREKNFTLVPGDIIFVPESFI